MTMRRKRFLHGEIKKLRVRPVLRRAKGVPEVHVILRDETGADHTFILSHKQLEDLHRESLTSAVALGIPLQDMDSGTRASQFIGMWDGN